MNARRACVAALVGVVACGCQTPSMSKLFAWRKTPAANPNEDVVYKTGWPYGKKDPPPEPNAADDPAFRADTITALIESGQKAETAKRFSDAKRHYEQALAIDPQHPVVNHRLAILADNEQRFQEAERRYQIALEANPANSELLADMGYSYFLQKRYEDAEAALQRSLSYQPAHKRALSNLGIVYAERYRTGRHPDDYQRAYDHFRLAANPQAADDRLRTLFPEGPPPQFAQANAPAAPAAVNGAPNPFTPNPGAIQAGGAPNVDPQAVAAGQVQQTNSVGAASSANPMTPHTAVAAYPATAAAAATSAAPRPVSQMSVEELRQRAQTMSPAQLRQVMEQIDAAGGGSTLPEPALHDPRIAAVQAAPAAANAMSGDPRVRVVGAAGQGPQMRAPAPAAYPEDLPAGMHPNPLENGRPSANPPGLAVQPNYYSQETDPRLSPAGQPGQPGGVAAPLMAPVAGRDPQNWQSDPQYNGAQNQSWGAGQAGGDDPRRAAAQIGLSAGQPFPVSEAQATPGNWGQPPAGANPPTASQGYGADPRMPSNGSTGLAPAGYRTSAPPANYGDGNYGGNRAAAYQPPVDARVLQALGEAPAAPTGRRAAPASTTGMRAFQAPANMPRTAELDQFPSEPARGW